MAKNRSIGNLNVRITAITADFNKGLGRASKRLKSFSRLMRTDVSRVIALAAGKLAKFGLNGLGAIPRLASRAIAGLAKFAAFLTGTFIVAVSAASAALIFLTKKSFADIDRIAKAAKVLGSTVAELQGLELAASEAAIENTALNKSLRLMTRNLNDAAQGTGEAVQAFRDLGLDAEHLASLSIPEQFKAISDAIRDVGDEGKRIQIAADLFGGRGIDLIRLTSQAIDDATKVVKGLGLAISDIDAGKIEAANDSAGRLRLTFKGLGDQLAIRVAPAIEAISNFLIRKLIEAGGVSEVVNKTIAKLGPIVAGGIDFIAAATQGALSLMTRILNRVGEFFDEMQGRSSGVASAVVKAFRNMADGIMIAFKGVETFVRGIITFIATGLGVLAAAVVQIWRILPGKNEARERAADAALGFIEGFIEELAQGTADAAKATAKLIADATDPNRPGILESLGIMGDTQRQATKFFSDLSFSAATTTEKMEAFTKTFLDGRTLSAALNEELKSLVETNTSLGLGVQDVAEHIITAQEEGDKLGIVAQNMQKGMDEATDGIVSGLLSGENAFLSLRNIAQEVALDIANAFAKQAVLGFLGTFAAGLGGGFLSGVFGGASAKAIGDSAPQFAPSEAQRGGDTSIVIDLRGSNGSEELDRKVEKGVRRAIDLSEVRISKRLGRDQQFVRGT